MNETVWAKVKKVVKVLVYIPVIFYVVYFYYCVIKGMLEGFRNIQ